MIPDLSKFYVRSFDLDHVNIFWEFENIQFIDDTLVYDFYLSKSESVLGPFTKVAGPFSNKYHFQDSTNPAIHKTRKVYYKLKVVNRLTNEEREFGPTSQIAEPDLIALELVRQEDMLFRQWIGRKCIVYPRKTIGPKCVCQGPISKRQLISNCMTCYGTGTLGGYLSPIEAYIQVDPTPKMIQLSQEMANQQPLMTKARMINYPPLKHQDVIIENENIRWVVIAVSTTERLRHPIHQELDVKQVLKSDMAYKLPMLTDIENVEGIAEERNFTNPHTIRNDTDITYTEKPRGTIQ